MKVGDTIQFNVPFAIDMGVHKGDEGEIIARSGSYFVVVAKRRRWLCRPHEVRSIGTEIDPADLEQIDRDRVLIEDFERWIGDKRK
jgi:hypothetical protein